jgi:uncharacterized protein YeaO (DUF488 family)
MPVAIKRDYESATKPDGYRVPVDRLWPREISKANAKMVLWLPNIGPSTRVRRCFNHDPDRWTVFPARYRSGLTGTGPRCGLPRRRAKREPVTLLYSARDK